MQVRFPRSRPLLALSACVAVAAALRLLLMTDWLSYDECVNYMIGKSAFWSDFLLQYSMRAHPPLSYIATKPFLALGSSPLMARGAALLAGLASVVLLHFVLREALDEPWSGSRAGNLAEAPALWLGTLLLAATPIFVQQSIQVRGYSLCLAFVWASLWVALRIRASGSERSGDHVALAALGVLALLTEFGAFFHLAALSAVLYAPLLLDWTRRARWRRVLLCGSPLLVGVLLALVNFAWQMGSSRPEWGHTMHAMYAGSLSDPGAIVAYAVERFPAQMAGILPNPWGLLLLALLLVPFTPLVGRSRTAGTARLLATYSLIALALVFAASLLRRFPLGGVPRHGVVIFPGILLAGLLTLVALLRHLFESSRARSLAAAATLAGVVPAFVLGLVALRSDARTAGELRDQIGVADYEAAPGPVVTNFKSRPMFSWWFREGTQPRRRYADITRFLVYDYDGIPVVRPGTPQEVLSTALFYAKQTGRSWILLSYPPAAKEFEADHAFLERELAAHPGISVPINRKVEWIRDTIVIKLEAEPFGAAAQREALPGRASARRSRAESRLLSPDRQDPANRSSPRVPAG